MRDFAGLVRMRTHANRIGHGCFLNAHGTCYTVFLRRIVIERQSNSITNRYSDTKPRLNSHSYSIDNAKPHTDSHCHAVNDANTHVDRNTEYYAHSHSNTAPSSWCTHFP